jgi:hypothetical protein
MNREKYITEMRKTFSNPNSIHPNGEINHKYFQTKIGQYWADQENLQLTQGLEEFGVGFWAEIKSKYLKNWVNLSNTSPKQKLN